MKYAAFQPPPQTVEEEKEEAPVEDDIKSKLDEIDSIASEALNEMKKESSEDPFNSINSMLGTSYDDFVPANKDNTEAAEENPVVEQAAVSSVAAGTGSGIEYVILSAEPKYVSLVT